MDSEGHWCAIHKRKDCAGIWFAIKKISKNEEGFKGGPTDKKKVQ